MSLQEEAEAASIAYNNAFDSDEPVSYPETFIAGFKAAAESRDQRIKDLEENLRCRDADWYQSRK